MLPMYKGMYFPRQWIFVVGGLSVLNVVNVLFISFVSLLFMDCRSPLGRFFDCLLFGFFRELNFKKLFC